ncbi:MAG: hypothetical protein KU38_10770 [Sulfurovum sp. FS08-3]|nr:MAG: hypothetical protein KU38_10770 [Sulfurovum sp. FS08-3]
MPIVATYFSHRGDRDSNEDALLIDRELIQTQIQPIQHKTFESNKALFALADGMGGENNGEEASWLVLSQLLQEYETLSVHESIIDTLHNAKKRLDSEAFTDSTKRNFGSTIAGVLLQGDRATVFNSGDSRVYRLSGVFLEQLSRDHSHVQNLVDRGLLECTKINHHPHRNLLSSAIVGDLSNTMPQIEIKTIALKPIETFLICSDGVWEAMSLETMESCFGEPNAIECLIDRVNNSHNRDNFSIIVVEMKLHPFL